MKLPGYIFLSSFSFLFLSASAATAQVGIVDKRAIKKPTLVVLGTYHMTTTTTNVVNNQVDDITSPERQKQVVELVGKLKSFKPTKIALECDVTDNTRIQGFYDQYLNGNRQLSKNETNQIGFRLAKELGHKKVYCVDWGIFPDDPLYNYEKYAVKDPELNDFLKGVYDELKKDSNAETEKLRTLSVTDQLIFLNQPERWDESHQRYFEFTRIGLGQEYVGANYLSWWYGRNMKILVNLIRLTDSMDDRILVVYGNGHNKLLNQFAKESDFYTVESPLKYLKTKK
jgi:hypothetical protein